jgi:hypothetical protein
VLDVKGSAKPSSTDRMDPTAYFIGATGPHVTWLGERLVVHGFDDHYSDGPGPTFSEADRKNVADFQHAQGWTGAAADGFPGDQTLVLLAADPKVTVPPPAPETKDLIVLPRDEWTSTPNGRADRPLTASKVVAFTIHYPGDGDLTYRDLTEKEVAARLRAYRLSHLGRGWADIGYNYAIDQAGRVWFLTGDTIGAHSNDAGNPTSIGVLFVVGNTEKPTPAAIAAFRALRAAKLAKYPKATKVQGHQQVPGNQTSCPGAPIMALIRAGTLSGSGAPTPAPGPDPAPEPKPDLTDLAWIRALTLNIKGIYNGRLTASRARGLAKIIGKSRASLVNAQEVGGPREAKLLLDALNAGGGNWKYTRFGGSEPIATAVYWDDDKYLLLADEQLETEGTHRWGTGCVFRHRESRVVFVDVTSHLQYLPKGKNTIRKYDQERERQWRAILQQGKGEAVKWRDELNLDLVPVIGSADMNGDANDAYDGPGKAMASEGFNDSDRVAAKRIDGDKGTTANTDGKFDKGNRIDRWSLDDEGVECVEQETWFGYPHTDHNGVSVSLKITNRKAA